LFDHTVKGKIINILLPLLSATADKGAWASPAGNKREQAHAKVIFCLTKYLPYYIDVYKTQR